MIHACYGLHCRYQTWEGECALPCGACYPDDAACVRSTEACGDGFDEEFLPEDEGEAAD